MGRIQAIQTTKCLIIGYGPAGYTAAIYAGRAGLQPILYTGMVDGGQLTQSTEIENFPGYPNVVTGSVMMYDLQEQAERFGVDIRYGYVNKVDFLGSRRLVYVDELICFQAQSVIIATGASAKWLGLDYEKKYNGFGGSACAVCDGYFFRGEDVAIVGGGDTAAEEATYLAKLCRKVYMLVRRGVLSSSKPLEERVMGTSNIELICNAEIDEILGDGQSFTGVRFLNKKTGSFETVDITVFFFAIGHHPNTDIFSGILDMDINGYIITKSGTTETNISGVFCRGDAQDHRYRQAVTVAASGCMAALDAERYLTKHDRCELPFECRLV